MDVKPNSNRFESEKKETAIEKKKVEKVASGKIRRKSEAKKITDIFISEDAHNVKNYILLDVLVPAVKKALSDVVKNGIDMILYGSTASNRDTSRASKISYRSYYDNPETHRTSGSRIKNSCDYDDIVFESRGEAEEVLEKMDELIETYGAASILDFYEFAGITTDYTYNKYGWTDVHTAKVVRVSGDGYMIRLPKAMPL